MDNNRLAIMVLLVGRGLGTHTWVSRERDRNLHI